MQTRSLALATLLGAFGVGLTGCELIAAVDHDLINQGGGGATAGGGGTGATGAGEDGGGGTDPGGGGSGAGVECMDPEECGAPPECQVATCEDGECGTADADDRTTCDLKATDDGLCSAGECVECIDADDCEGEDVCSKAGVCQPEHCDNDMVDDGIESDEDCGIECEPCENDLNCVDDGDCSSGFCDEADTTCRACADSDDCPANQWCDPTDDDGTCTDDLAPGGTCTGDDQCAGACADVGASSVCCDEACEGSCESCLMIHTGVANGTCADVTADSDPKDMCADEACTTGMCAAGGSCGLEPNTTTCGNGPTCDGDNLDQQQFCSGNSAACAAAAETDCLTYSCDTAATPDACFGSCDAHSDCSDEGTGAYCVGVGGATGTNANACEAKKILLANCVEDVECISDNCAGGVCTAI